jgi:hypothetical protein
LDDEELKDEFDKRAKTDEHLTASSKDAWGMYKKKIGIQSHMWIPKTSAPANSGVGRAPSIIIKKGAG